MSPPFYLPPYSSGDQHLLLYRIFFVFLLSDFTSINALDLDRCFEIGRKKLRTYRAAIVLPLACGRSNLKAPIIAR